MVLVAGCEGSEGSFVSAYESSRKKSNRVRSARV